MPRGETEWFTWHRKNAVKYSAKADVSQNTNNYDVYLFVEGGDMCSDPEKIGT